MTRRLLGFLGLLLLAAPARASDPVGVYALIEKAEIEGADGQAERIRLHGVFAVAVGNRGDDYTTPMRGYIYFTLPKENQDTARKEWNDLKKLAGSGTAVAFGSRYKLKDVKVRTDRDTTKGAVLYTLDIGLTKLGKDHHYTKAFLAVKPKP